MCGCAVENAILQWRDGPDDTNATRTLRSPANGCLVTDHKPQEGPSFRTGLHGSPLILVVWFSGVHGNNDISTNTAFKFSQEERQLRGERWVPSNQGQKPDSLHCL